MKSSLPARIMLVTALLALYMNTAIAEQENLTDGYAMFQGIYNNSSLYDITSVLITPEIFDIPGFSNLTSNEAANYYYSKVIY
jgi:hypothetical protein